MRIHRPRLHIIGHLPHLGQDPIARDDGGPVADEHPEQLELLLRQLDLLAVDGNAERAAVDAKVAVVVDRRIGLGSLGAAKNGSDTVLD